MQITIWSSPSDPKPRAVPATWPGDFLEVDHRESKEGPCWSPATFDADKAALLGYCNEAVERLHALVLDLDHLTPEQAATVADPWLDYELVLHTSYRHTTDAPRLRLILPLAEPVTPAEHARLWAWAVARAGVPVDRACKDARRLYFAPSAPVGSEEAFCMHSEGRRLALSDAGPAPLAEFGVLERLRSAGRASQVEHLFAGIEKAALVPAGPPPKVELLEAKCATLRHAAEHPESIGEPLWYAALSVWGRCEDGEAVAHARSKGHPGYTRSATQQKLTRALEDTGPRTCQGFRELEGNRCEGCPLSVTSPVVLGRPDKQADPVGHAEAVVLHADARLERARAAMDAATQAEVDAKAHLTKAKQVLRFAEDKETAERVLREAVDAHQVARRQKVEAAKELKAAERAASAASVAGAPPAAADPLTWASLAFSQGKPMPNMANLLKIMQGDPAFADVRLNTIGQVLEWRGQVVSEFRDLGDVVMLLADRYLISASPKEVHWALSAAASRNEYNSAREWLSNLPAWDGEPRVRELLTRVLRVEDRPLYQAFIRKMLLAGYRRAMHPGCKADAMLILQGKGNIGKSLFFRTLFGHVRGGFSDTDIDLGSKDGRMQLHAAWCYELGELSALASRDIEAVKVFLSQQEDQFRRPYGYVVETFKRHTLIVGTTNQPVFLSDLTGTRKFWSIPLTTESRLDLSWVAERREQIWAEVRHLAEIVGEDHYLNESEDAERESDAEQFTEEPAWAVRVERFVASQKGKRFTSSDVLEALGVPADRQGYRLSRDLGNVLRRLGCVARSVKVGGVVRKGWAGPVSDDAPIINASGWKSELPTGSDGNVY